MATLKDRRALIAELEAKQVGEIDSIDLADMLLSSLFIGGCLSLKNGASPDNDLVIKAGWNRCDGLFNRSVDVRGIRDGLNDPEDPGAYFEIKQAGAGLWVLEGLLIKAVVDQAGAYSVRWAHVDIDGNSQTTPYESEVSAIAPGDELVFLILAGIRKTVEAGERLQPEIRGPNGAVVSARAAQFMCRQG